MLVSAGKSRQEAVAAIREERAAWTSAGMSRSCPWRSSSPGRMWRRVGTSLVLSRTGCRPLWLEPGDQGGRVGGAVGVRILSKLGRGDRLIHTSATALGCLVEDGLGVGRGPWVEAPAVSWRQRPHAQLSVSLLKTRRGGDDTPAFLVLGLT